MWHRGIHKLSPWGNNWLSIIFKCSGTVQQTQQNGLYDRLQNYESPLKIIEIEKCIFTVK